MGDSDPNADGANALTRLRDGLSRTRRWLRLPEARAAGITLVGLAGAHAMVGPAAAQMGNKMGSAICKTGAGKLFTAALFLIAIALIYSSIGDFYRGVKKGRSKNTGQRSQQGGDFEAGGMKIGGGLVIASLPTILSTVGFSLLSCVKAVQIF
jgi:hypothetical protein